MSPAAVKDKPANARLFCAFAHKDLELTSLDLLDRAWKLRPGARHVRGEIPAVQVRGLPRTAVQNHDLSEAGQNIESVNSCCPLFGGRFGAQVWLKRAGHLARSRRIRTATAACLSLQAWSPCIKSASLRVSLPALDCFRLLLNTPVLLYGLQLHWSPPVSANVSCTYQVSCWASGATSACRGISGNGPNASAVTGRLSHRQLLAIYQVCLTCHCATPRHSSILHSLSAHLTTQNVIFATKSIVDWKRE